MIPSGKRLQFANLKPWPSKVRCFTQLNSMVIFQFVQRLPEGKRSLYQRLIWTQYLEISRY